MGNKWNQRRKDEDNKDDNDQGFIELGPTWGFLKLFLSKEERKEGPVFRGLRMSTSPRDTLWINSLRRPLFHCSLLRLSPSSSSFSSSSVFSSSCEKDQDENGRTKSQCGNEKVLIWAALQPSWQKASIPAFASRTLPLLPLCPLRERRTQRGARCRTLERIACISCGGLEAGSTRLNMQITKCFIGNGLELRGPPTTPEGIWAPTSSLFKPSHIFAEHSINIYPRFASHEPSSSPSSLWSPSSYWLLRLTK